MKVDVEVDTDDLHSKKVDQQGRVYLSQKLAGKHVEFAIVDVDESD